MFVSFRAGLVLTWLALLSLASPWIVRVLAEWAVLARVISALSRHSLVAYVVHLSLLYGLPMLRGLHGFRPYDLYECSLACAFVLCVSVLSVLYWDRLRVFVVNLLRPAPRDEVRPSQLA
jgi:hypothetical protein